MQHLYNIYAVCVCIPLTWYFAMSLLFQSVCGTSWIDSLRLCVLSLKFRVFGSSRSFPPIWVSIWRTSCTEPHEKKQNKNYFKLPHRVFLLLHLAHWAIYFSHSIRDRRKPLIYLALLVQRMPPWLLPWCTQHNEKRLETHESFH